MDGHERPPLTLAVQVRLPARFYRDSPVVGVVITRVGGDMGTERYVPFCATCAGLMLAITAKTRSKMHPYKMATPRIHIERVSRSSCVHLYVRDLRIMLSPRLGHRSLKKCEVGHL